MKSNNNGVSVLETVLSRTVLAHAVAGSIGGMLAMTICYPLDRVRTLAQVGKSKTYVYKLLLDIINEEGWTGLYHGLGPVLIALGTSNFVYFYWYTALKVVARKLLSIRGELSGFANLLLASFAGSINVMITAPLWVVVTRLAIQSKHAQGKQALSCEKYDGMWDGIKKIYYTEGIGALWSGTVPSLILVSNPSVQFASYERLKQALVRVKSGHATPLQSRHGGAQIIEDPLTGFDYMVIGALAKMIATIVTYPLQVAQTKIRAEASKQGERSSVKQELKGTFDCLIEISRAEGVSGLYRGMDAKILQTCSTSAFMFVFYEKISSLIFSLLIRRKLPSLNPK